VSPYLIPSLPSLVSRLRLKQLRLLVTLYDHGSLIKAAEQVHMSQPGATKALKEIESALGFSLFMRSHRGIEPNALGRCVVRYARLILSDLAHLREELHGIVNGQGGRLAVGTIMGAVPFLTEAIDRLLEKQKTLSVEVVEDTSLRLLELLDQGRLDAAICRVSVSDHPDMYTVRHVRQEELAVVANPHSVFFARDEVSLHELSDCRWVVYSAGMPMRLLLEREFYEAELPFPSMLFETTSAFATVSFLQKQESAVALLSIDVAQTFQRFGLVAILPVKLQSKSQPYLLVTRKDRERAPVTELFLAEFPADVDAVLQEPVE
jgi:DNA-binding transcriptional LysR family regulator